MELKLRLHDHRALRGGGSNRTFMELKRVRALQPTHIYMF